MDEGIWEGAGEGLWKCLITLSCRGIALSCGIGGCEGAGVEENTEALYRWEDCS